MYSNGQKHLEKVIQSTCLKGQFWTKPWRCLSLFNTHRRNLDDY